jgi:hypothetical protein
MSARLRLVEPVGPGAMVGSAPGRKSTMPGRRDAAVIARAKGRGYIARYICCLERARRGGTSGALAWFTDVGDDAKGVSDGSF